MTPAETHTGVLAGLAQLEQLAAAAQPGGGWYREGRDVAARMPLLTAAEMAAVHPDEHEDWVFTAATTADARHIVAQQPKAVLAVLAGRRRIIERHAPTMTEALSWRASMPQCEACAERCHSSSGIACDDPIDGLWPCPDYRDAAADLLPTEGSPPP